MTDWAQNMASEINNRFALGLSDRDATALIKLLRQRFQERQRRLASPDLLEALQAVLTQIHDYERVNNLAPNPVRKYCWDSVAHAHDVIAKATVA